jgi:hypothetical protein
MKSAAIRTVAAPWAVIARKASASGEARGFFNGIFWHDSILGGHAARPHWGNEMLVAACALVITCRPSCLGARI